MKRTVSRGLSNGKPINSSKSDVVMVCEQCHRMKTFGHAWAVFVENWGHDLKNCSCTSVSMAPGRTSLTRHIASSASSATWLSSNSKQATVPARPNPPLQCTTTRIPSARTVRNIGASVCQGVRNRSSGAAPSVMGNPCQCKPCSIARAGKSVILSSSSSHGSRSVTKWVAPQFVMALRSVFKSRAHVPVIALAWCLPGAKVTPIAPPLDPTGNVAMRNG